VGKQGVDGLVDIPGLTTVVIAVVHGGGCERETCVDATDERLLFGLLLHRVSSHSLSPFQHKM
jgi:hypothetical protein